MSINRMRSARACAASVIIGVGLSLMTVLTAADAPPPAATAEHRGAQPSLADGRAPRGDDPALARAGRLATDRVQRSQRRRQSAAGRAERSRSRRVHHDLGARGALRTARAAFPGIVERQAWTALPSQGPRRRVKYLDSHTARVAGRGGGHSALLHSTLPLRGRDEDGTLAPVDLRLARGPDGLEPVNPIVATTIGDVVGAGIQLPEVGVRVTSAVQNPRARARRLDGMAFFANADADTDLLVRPIPEGFQTFVQLRSPRSPERHTLRLDVPDGARVRPSGSGPGVGGYEIVRGRDVLAHVGPPRAVDAQGEPVVTSSRVAGDRLELGIRHRSRDIAYPVMVDPTFVQDSAQWKDSLAPNYSGWTPLSNSPAKFKSLAGNSYLGTGLYTYTRTLNTYSPTDYSGWAFDARGYGSAYVYEAQFRQLYHDGLYNDLHVETGIWHRPTGTWEAAPSSTLNGFFDYRDHPKACARPSGTTCLIGGRPGTAAFFRTRTANSAQYNSFTDYLGAATVLQADDVLPKGTLTGLPNGWTRGVADTAITISFEDTGLGMTNVGLARASGAAWNQSVRSTAQTCTGGIGSPCPRTLPATFGTGDLPDGEHELSLTGTDIMDARTTHRGADGTLPKLKVDRELPDVTLSGRLWDSRYAGSPRLADLVVDARDGVLGGTATQRRSGVAKIDISVDGVRQEPSTTQSCVDSCPLRRAFTATLADGPHTIEVTVTDQAGNATVLRWWVMTDGSAPPACAPRAVAPATVPAPSGTPPPAGTGEVLEQPAAVAAPDVRRQPVFDGHFTAADAGGFAPSGQPECHVAVAANDTHLVVSSERNGSVEVRNVKTSSHLRVVTGFPGARGVTLYGGEGFVVDRDNRITAFDPATGAIKRRFSHPSTLLVGTAPALRNLAVTGLDSGWGELWATFQTPAGAGVTVLDAQTGTPKAVFWQLPRYDCAGNALALQLLNTADCVGATGVASACASGVETSADGLVVAATACRSRVTTTHAPQQFNWWDVATVPELGGTVAGCRFIDRASFLSPTAALTEVTALTDQGWQQCADGRYQDGTDGVWGMRWLVALNGDSRARPSTRVNDYSLARPSAGGQAITGPQRTWQPVDAAIANHRDVAYRNRELRIDWSGDLKRTDWMRGIRCADYKVSDADIFVIGARGERWIELARAFDTIVLRIGGVERARSTEPQGRLCANTDHLASGTHGLTLTATARPAGVERTASAGNTTLRIDHDPPSVGLGDVPRWVRATTRLAGSNADVHSGPRDWGLQYRPSGASAWTDACVPATVNACDWNTTTVPDGVYDVRGQGRDRVADDLGGPNVGHSAFKSVTVDNTPPVVDLAGLLWQAREGGEIEDDLEADLSVSGSDVLSGVARLAVAVDGTERTSADDRLCPEGTCAAPLQYILYPENEREGGVPVLASVTDRAGNVREVPWVVSIERRPPPPTEEDEWGHEFEQGDGAGAPPPSSSASAASGNRSIQYPWGQPPQNLDHSLLSCTRADEPANFPVFSVGPVFEGLPAGPAQRICEARYIDELIRQNSVTFVYGDCTPAPGQYACMPPLAIKSWPACERSRGDLWTPDGPLPRENLVVRGVPAAKYDTGIRLEVYTGTTTVVIWGTDRAQVVRAAAQLHREALNAAPGLPDPFTTSLPLLDLPQPVDGAIEGRLPC